MTLALMGVLGVLLLAFGATMFSLLAMSWDDTRAARRQQETWKRLFES